MQNDYIIPTGIPDNINPYEELDIPESKYLEIDNKLKEIADNNYQELARSNLEVPSILELLLVKTDVSVVNDLVESVHQHLHHAIKVLSDQITDMESSLSTFVKADCSVPFVSNPLVGDGKSLITEEEVDSKLKSYYTKAQTDSEITTKINLGLSPYALKSDVYDRKHSYNAKTIDSKLDEYVRKDRIGSYNYVNAGTLKDQISRHNTDPNAHCFNEILKTALRSYYKKSEVYTQAQTYTRALIDTIVNKLVDNACEDLIERHVNTIPHLTSQEVYDIIQNYADTYLISTSKLEDALEDVKADCEKHKPIWRTSGPVLTTVGFVEDNTLLPPELTLQQILDLIFYGSKVSISADETAGPYEEVDVTMCLHSGLPVKSITLYKNGVAIDWFVEEEFAEGCITKSYPVSEDSEFTFTVVYDDDSELSDSTTVTIYYPIFVGILPRMKPESEITLAYLKELIRHDSVNNEFTEGLPVVHKYDFKDPKLQNLIVGIPTNYNKKIDSMSNQGQTFTSEAFDFHRIELTFCFTKENKSMTLMYDFYTYRQPLSSLNSEVTFNFA